MLGKILLVVLVAVLGVLIFNNVTTVDDFVFRGYPSDDYLKLPVMTLSELKGYNGIDSNKIFTSVKNVVFDVTDSGFYTFGSHYHSFAGHDSTLMIAYWKASPEFANLYNTKTYDNLTEQQRQGVDDMFDNTYRSKYTQVARIWFPSVPLSKNQTRFTDGEM